MPKTGLDALLRPQDSIVVLIDHQPFQFANLNSHDPAAIVNNVVGLAKGAKVFDVPTVPPSKRPEASTTPASASTPAARPFRP